MKSRSDSKEPAHLIAVPEQKPGKSHRTTPSGYLERISATFLKFFARKRKRDGRYDLCLGDQVKLPEEFLKNVAQSPSSGKSKQR